MYQSLFFSYFPSVIFGDRTQLHGLRTSYLLSTVLGILWWPPSPACLGVRNKAAKTSLQLSFTSAVQTRNCPSRKPTLWILWHFPPSDSDTFFRAFSKGQRQHIRQSSVLPALPLWAGTAVTQGHSGEEALRDLRELWQIMGTGVMPCLHQNCGSSQDAICPWHCWILLFLPFWANYGNWDKREGVRFWIGLSVKELDSIIPLGPF